MASCKKWAAETANGELQGVGSSKSDRRAARGGQLKKRMASRKGWAAEKANGELQGAVSSEKAKGELQGVGS